MEKPQQDSGDPFLLRFMRDSVTICRYRILHEDLLAGRHLNVLCELPSIESMAAVSHCGQSTEMASLGYSHKR